MNFTFSQFECVQNQQSELRLQTGERGTKMKVTRQSGKNEQKQFEVEKMKQNEKKSSEDNRGGLK